MARYKFTPGKEYAGRVHAVWKKPVENAGLSLVRLEFEVFQFLEGNRLASTGKVACRDIVVGADAALDRDQGVWPYLSALGITPPYAAGQWLRLNERRAWVKIVFGPVSPLDHRNAFKGIFALEASGYQVKEFDYDIDAELVTVSQAADDLECSEATIRRLVARYEPEFGERLVRRTPGGHRRINIRLLRNVD